MSLISLYYLVFTLINALLLVVVVSRWKFLVQKWRALTGRWPLLMTLFASILHGACSLTWLFMTLTTFSSWSNAMTPGRPQSDFLIIWFIGIACFAAIMSVTGYMAEYLSWRSELNTSELNSSNTDKESR